MEVGGIAHAHIRVIGRGAVLRVPRVSQFGLAPTDNLAYQAACFERARPSGRTPRLLGVLPVGSDLPRGALLVEEIAGRAVALPGDLPAIAEALARIHELPVPPAAGRAPLRDHRDPVAETLETILSQAAHLHDARLHPDALAAIAEELGWARQFAGEIAAGLIKAAQPVTLAATDTHPGNFLIDGGRAVFIDLEKMLYGSPAIDLAHATLYTSTTWEPKTAAVLTVEQTAGFYRSYLSQLANGLAVALRPWLLPMRRITWLRTITWMVRWRAVSAARPDDPALGGWSRTRLEPQLVRHILARIEDFTNPATIARIRAEWAGHSLLEPFL
jgi:aminoglycoside phosphotransferase (APT) family kinase protein